MTLLAGQTIGGNLIKTQIGNAGGFGTAYEVENSNHQTPIVLKLLTAAGNTEAESRFNKENRILKQLSPHDRIITPLSDVLKEGPHTYYLMELADSDLFGYVDQKQKLSQNLLLSEIKKIMIEVCEGLQHAHSKQVAHRDLHKGNVLLKKVLGNNSVKLCDFGLAKDFNISDLLSINDHVMGATEIIPPERMFDIWEKPSIEDYCPGDIYALGSLMYFLFNLSPAQAHGFAMWASVTAYLATNGISLPNVSYLQRENTYRYWLKQATPNFFEYLKIQHQDRVIMDKANILLQNLCHPDISQRMNDFSIIISEINKL